MAKLGSRLPPALATSFALMLAVLPVTIDHHRVQIQSSAAFAAQPGRVAGGLKGAPRGLSAGLGRLLARGATGGPLNLARATTNISVATVGNGTVNVFSHTSASVSANGGVNVAIAVEAATATQTGRATARAATRSTAIAVVVGAGTATADSSAEATITDSGAVSATTSAATSATGGGYAFASASATTSISGGSGLGPLSANSAAQATASGRAVLAGISGGAVSSPAAASGDRAGHRRMTSFEWLSSSP
jgi:hypothetical protein